MTKRRRDEGFSLIEVLVATVILAFIVVLMGGVLRQLGSAWVKGEARTRSRDNGRTIAEFIGRELQGSLAPLDSGDTQGLQWVLNPGDPGEMGNSDAWGVPVAYRNPDAFFWQAPLATRRDFGDLAVVGYFVKWAPATEDRPPKALLCRFFVNPAAADPTEPGQSLPNPYFRIYEEPDKWLTKKILDDVAPGGDDNDYSGLFAENVLGLWVNCFDRTGKEIAGASSGGSFDSRIGYTENGVKKVLPATVDVSFVVIDPRTAGRIDAGLQALIIAEAKLATDAADFVDRAFKDSRMNPIREGLRVHSKRIKLLNAQ